MADANITDLVMLVDDNDIDNFISKRIIEITKFANEFEKFNQSIKDKCKVVILSSSDNKRDIDKIVNNDHVIKFITKPLTETALSGIKITS